MFVLRKVGGILFGSGENKETLIELPQGQLYLVRPLSPKGYSELIFKDAAATIRRTALDFHYQLVIQRVYEDGEAELLAEEEGEDAEIDALAGERDEKTFLLDEALHLRFEIREGTDKVIAWRDLSGDTGDVYEFVCEGSVASSLVSRFERVARQCQYERRYRRPHASATEGDLARFAPEDEDPIPPASPLHGPAHTLESADSVILSSSVRIDSPPPPLLPAVPSIEATLAGRSIGPAASYYRDRGPDPDEEEEDEQSEYVDAPANMGPAAPANMSAKRAAAAPQSGAMAGGPAVPAVPAAVAAAPAAAPVQEPTPVPASADQPTALENYATERAELHFFDFPSGAFIIKDDDVTAAVTEVGPWEYWLQIQAANPAADRAWLGVPITTDINPVFNFEYLSFIFNMTAPDQAVYSWLLRFRDKDTMERFQEALLRCLWEQANGAKWLKVKDTERDYITSAFADLAMEDMPEGDDDDEAAGLAGQEDEDEDKQQQSDEEEDGDGDDGDDGDDNDDDDDDDQAGPEKGDGNVNSQLAVGSKNNRTYVVRGDMIGVFRHRENDSLQFTTAINKVRTPTGRRISPKKVMLHNEDRDMILQHEHDPHKLYRMDIEYGKVVDEWNVHDDIPVVSFAPEEKFAQLTGRDTFLGISHNALFRIDPRAAGNIKLDPDKLKQYATKNDFSAAATTEKGHIAVASNKGDIRLFDRLGINAKTHIPALGEAIIGLDTSADGRWVLATCRTYLLLVDTLQKGGKNEGKLGFERAFPADSKPQPRRLTLSPEHVAQLAHETRKPVSFTPAKFNTGAGVEETSIITATGPYIVEWNLRKVVRGTKSPYHIKRYREDVKADDFKFGSDKSIIVALPNEINMVGKQSLKKPTRESIAGDFLDRAGGGARSTPRRSSGRIGGGRDSGGRYKLGKDDVVNSPY